MFKDVCSMETDLLYHSLKNLCPWLNLLSFALRKMSASHVELLFYKIAHSLIYKDYDKDISDQ